MSDTNRPDMAPPAAVVKDCLTTAPATADTAPPDYGEPWHALIDRTAMCIELVDRNGRTIAEHTQGHPGGVLLRALRRAEACVNMAAGVPTGALPKPGVLPLLLEALEARRKQVVQIHTARGLDQTDPEQNRVWQAAGADCKHLVIALDRALALLSVEGVGGGDG